MEPKFAEDSGVSLMEVDVGDSAELFGRFLESQRELFRGQVDNLQRIVVEQCKLTGANPLSQEMAAGALSIKIGKRPRDLMNPKAVKYMQSVFSIKDSISKKETRDISALCGVTATQVRDFFSGQRSRVRTFVRLSREKADKLNPVETYNDACPIKSGLDMPVCSQSVACTTDVKVMQGEESHHDMKSEEWLQDVRPKEGVKDVKPEACSLQEENLPDLDPSEKNFVENIFVLMEKEETFTGQVKLLEWILRVHNAAISVWFLSKGGLTILTTWLNLAVIEEQTSILLVILKVLSHLPLHKALPVQMSAILQTVNKLRFYRTSDISNRAKALLSKWSKLFVRSQALKNPSPSKPIPDTMKEMLHRQRINQILGDEAYISKIEMPDDDALVLTYDALESSRTSDTTGLLKMLPGPSADSNKKLLQSVPRSYTKERRKLLLVENPDFRTAGRNSPPTRSAQANKSRPLSADDIQKAKMRAIYMKTKYGKLDTSEESIENKSETNKKSATITDDERFSSCSDAERMLPEVSIELGKKSNVKLLSSISNGASIKPEKCMDLEAKRLPKKSHLVSSLSPSKLTTEENMLKEDSCVSSSSALQVKENVALQERLELNVKPESSDSRTMATHKDSDLISRPVVQWSELEKLKRSKIPWCTPPVVRIRSSWSLGSGEDSKEVEVQTKRIRREKETAYYSTAEIPSDPKEPWDVEMDFDDSLTPVIPTEQPPEVDTSEASSCSTSCVPSLNLSATFKSNLPEPDLELLAVLLKNPDLVFALTSGQASSIPNTQMLQVLDMLKTSGMGMSGLLSKMKEAAGELVKLPVSHTAVSLPSPTPASLPSPTPPSDPTMRWKLDPTSAPEVVESTVVSSLPSAPSRPLFNQTSNGRASDIPPGAERLTGSSTDLFSQARASTRWPNLGPPSSPLSLPPQQLSATGNGREYFQLTGTHSMNSLALPSTNLKSDPVSTSGNHPYMNRPINSFSPPVSVKNYSIPLPARRGEPSHLPPLHTSRSGKAVGTGNMFPMQQTSYNSRAHNYANNNAHGPHTVASQIAYGQLTKPFPLANSSWGGVKLLDEPEFESWSPERDRNLDWRSVGQNYGRGYNNHHEWRRPNPGRDQGHSFGRRNWPDR